MMQIWSTRLLPAIAIAGLILLVGVPGGAADFGEEPFAPAAKDAKHLRFSTSFSSSDPFAGMNQVTAGKARRGDTFQVVLTGTLAKGFHTYPLTRRAPKQDADVLSKVQIASDTSFVPLYPRLETDNAKWHKPRGDSWGLELEKPFAWTFEFYVKPDATVGSTRDITFRIKTQVCSTACFLEDHVLKVSVPIGSEEPITPPLDITERTKPIAPIVVPLPPGVTESDGDSGDSNSADNTSNRNQAPTGLLQAILIAIGGGFISLLTPCVFPMIPITVSYFLKQSETKQGSALLMALVYSLTIVLVLALGGLLLLSVLTQISTHPVTNYILGAIFLFFGLSLLGWYDVTLPSWLQDATASGEGRGGLVGAFFMALTFSIVSFSCVGPIYGGFVSVHASGSTGQLQLVVSVVSFAVAFASPFFLLALFPQLLKKMPRAGSWMNSVKVVMGFLELAAVVKFVRAGELAQTGAADYLSYDLSLGIYVALCVACGLYLLGVYRLPHDHEAPETIGVPRLLFSLGFLTLALYLTPGLFKTASGQTMQPRGIVFGWIDSFLLPDPEGAGKWNTKLAVALEQAKKESRLVFIDFTGTLCTNCKLNERFAFPRPEIQDAMNKYVLLKLYTDKTPAGSEQDPSEAASLELRNTRFKTKALPHYALLEPVGDDFRIVRAYDGNLIQTPGERKAFVEFLTKK